MRRMFLWAVLAVAGTLTTGCETYDQTQAWRYERTCPDRAMDAGFCDQPTNWRLFQPERWGIAVVP